MFFVYVIENQNSKKIYIGQTSDLAKRLQRHNGLLPTKKKTFTKKNPGEWKYVYYEEFTTRTEAILREKQSKSSRGRDFIKKHIGSVAQLVRASAS